MIINVSPIIFLDVGLEGILYFEKTFQNEDLYWTWGGPAAESFAHGINPEDISLLLHCGGRGKNPPWRNR
jgi:hypothetical protein